MQPQNTNLARSLPAGRFRVEPAERMSFGDAEFDVVLSSAVMHFARDEAQWNAMLREMSESESSLGGERPAEPADRGHQTDHQ